MTEGKGASQPLHGVFAAGDVAPCGGEQHGPLLLRQLPHGLALALPDSLQDAFRLLPPRVRQVDGLVPAVLRQLLQPDPALLIEGGDDGVDGLLGQKAALAEKLLGALLRPIDGAEEGEAGLGDLAYSP